MRTVIGMNESRVKPAKPFRGANSGLNCTTTCFSFRSVESLRSYRPGCACQRAGASAVEGVHITSPHREGMQEGRHATRGCGSPS
jgi:hypothetical protein